MRRTVTYAATVTTVAGIAASLAVAPAFAKRPKCTAVPVAGQPGTYVVTCTTLRP